MQRLTIPIFINRRRKGKRQVRRRRRRVFHSRVERKKGREGSKRNGSGGVVEVENSKRETRDLWARYCWCNLCRLPSSAESLPPLCLLFFFPSFVRGSWQSALVPTVLAPRRFSVSCRNVRVTCSKFETPTVRLKICTQWRDVRTTEKKIILHDTMYYTYALYNSVRRMESGLVENSFWDRVPVSRGHLVAYEIVGILREFQNTHFQS